MIDPEFAAQVKRSEPTSVRIDPAVVGEAVMFVRQERTATGPRRQPTEQMLVAVYDGEVMGDAQHIQLSDYIASGRFRAPQ